MATERKHVLRALGARWCTTGDGAPITPGGNLSDAPPCVSCRLPRRTWADVVEPLDPSCRLLPQLWRAARRLGCQHTLRVPNRRVLQEMSRQQVRPPAIQLSSPQAAVLHCHHQRKCPCLAPCLLQAWCRQGAVWRGALVQCCVWCETRLCLAAAGGSSAFAPQPPQGPKAVTSFMRRTASGLRGLFPGAGSHTIRRSESGGRPSRLPRSARATGTLSPSLAASVPDDSQVLELFEWACHRLAGDFT